MLHAFPEETDQIQRFFHTLVFKGKRNVMFFVIITYLIAFNRRFVLYLKFVAIHSMKTCMNNYDHICTFMEEVK